MTPEGSNLTSQEKITAAQKAFLDAFKELTDQEADLFNGSRLTVHYHTEGSEVPFFEPEEEKINIIIGTPDAEILSQLRTHIIPYLQGRQIVKSEPELQAEPEIQPEPEQIEPENASPELETARSEYKKTCKDLENVVSQLSGTELHFLSEPDTEKAYEEMTASVRALADVLSNGIANPGLIRIPNLIRMSWSPGVGLTSDGDLFVGPAVSETEIFDALKLQELDDAAATMVPDSEPELHNLPKAEPVVEPQEQGVPATPEQEAAMDRLEAAEAERREKKGWGENLIEKGKKVVGKTGEIVSRTLESETARKILATKVINGYLKLSKTQRFLVNTALIGTVTAVGTAIGGATAVGALGYGGYRVARAAASFGASTLANVVVSRKEAKLEKEFKNKEKELEERLSAPSYSDNQKDIYRETFKKGEGEEYEKKRKRLAKIKFGSTVAAGVGAGLLAGLAEHALASGASVAETTASLRPKLSDQAPSGPKAPVTELSKEIPKEIADAPKEIPKVSTPPLEVKATMPKPEDMKFTIPKGGSRWGGIEKILEHDDRFTELDRAGKDNVVATLNNMIDKNGNFADFGLNADGSVDPGDTLDISKLLGDEEKVSNMFEHAKNLSASAKENILENRAKIAEWVKMHPGEEVNAETVEKILNGTIEEATEAPIKTMPQSETRIDQSSHELPADAPAIKHELPYDAPTSEPINWMPDENEIPKPQASVPNAEPNQVLTRSMNADLANVDVGQVKAAVKNGLDDIYGSKGILGFGQTAGASTREWGIVRGILAKDLLDYYQGDSAASVLKPEVAKALGSSDKHFKFVQQLQGMMMQSRGALKPFDNEKTEDFLTRSVQFMLKQSPQIQNQVQAA